MKRNLFFWNVLVGMFALVSVFSACSDDDDDHHSNRPGQEQGPGAESIAPKAVQKAFDSQFPDATNVAWREQVQYGQTYFVASFDRKQPGRALDNRSNQAWFLQDGTLSLSEQELPLGALEQEADYAAILKTWKASVYAEQGFHISEIEVLSRQGCKERIVKLEVKKGREEFDLFFTFDGILVKAVADTDDDNEEADAQPDNLPCPTEVLKYLEAKYADAVLVDFEQEREAGKWEYEVTVLTKMGQLVVEKELVFNDRFEFLYAEIDFDDRVLVGLLQKFLTPEQWDDLVNLTGEKNPMEWDFDIYENAQGLLTVFVEDCHEKQVELVKDFDPSEWLK